MSSHWPASIMHSIQQRYIATTTIAFYAIPIILYADIIMNKVMQMRLQSAKTLIYIHLLPFTLRAFQFKIIKK